MHQQTGHMLSWGDKHGSREKHNEKDETEEAIKDHDNRFFKCLFICLI